MSRSICQDQPQMSKTDFQINITRQSVSVQLDLPSRSRIHATAFFVVLTILAMCALLFLPGRHGDPTMWQTLTRSRFGSTGFMFEWLLLLSFPLLMFFLCGRYAVAAFPSDEKLHCDQSTLTLSKARWLDFRSNQWDTRSYPLADVHEIRYRTVLSTKNATIYGLRFVAGGRNQKILPGLSPCDAEEILNALKALGADVPDDPKLQQKIKDDIPGSWPG